MSPSVAENLALVKQRIADAAARAGRSANDVTLVAVTKKRPYERVRELMDAGQRVVAENRVQEALGRIEAFGADGYGDLEWHMIGHLQTNKAKQVVGRFALIHSVDSPRLAQAIQQAAESANVSADILLQVNVSGEESKFGLEPAAVDATIEELKPLDRVRCRGLMTMAPYCENPEDTRQVFRRLRELRDRIADAGHEYIEMRHLSMGMTNDFEVAVEEGATLVRVGTALFQ